MHYFPFYNPVCKVGGGGGGGGMHYFPFYNPACKVGCGGMYVNGYYIIGQYVNRGGCEMIGIPVYYPYKDGGGGGGGMEFIGYYVYEGAAGLWFTK